MASQVCIPRALTAVHNFIHICDKEEILNFEDLEDGECNYSELADGPPNCIEKSHSKMKWDGIAQAMWESYWALVDEGQCRGMVVQRPALFIVHAHNTTTIQLIGWIQSTSSSWVPGMHLLHHVCLKYIYIYIWIHDTNSSWSKSNSRSWACCMALVFCAQSQEVELLTWMFLHGCLAECCKFWAKPTRTLTFEMASRCTFLQNALADRCLCGCYGWAVLFVMTFRRGACAEFSGGGVLDQICVKSVLGVSSGWGVEQAS